MTTLKRTVRLGSARRLTKAVLDGEFIELNSALKWDMPIG